MYNFSDPQEQHNYDYSNVPMELLPKAKILYPTIASITGLNRSNGIRLDSNFYELGGNSLNSVYTVLKLREQGFHVSITEFITASTIKDILLKMKSESLSHHVEDTIDPAHNKLEMLNDSHKTKVIE